MDYQGLKDTLVKWLAEKLLSRLDAEAIKGMLNALIARLREKSNETESLLDDWTVDALEDIVNDDVKIQIIADWARSILGKAFEVEGADMERLDVARQVLGNPCVNGGDEAGAAVKVAGLLKVLSDAMNAYFKEEE